MKIYTKKGDKGMTSLYGGKRLSKSNGRIEAYGEVDELNAFVALAIDAGLGAGATQLLLRVQNELFVVGAHLAADPAKKQLSLPERDLNLIAELEGAIDNMEQHLPPLRFFILPGGHSTVSLLHVCRCVCRRAERRCVAIAKTDERAASVVSFLNRLSDYFFVLARSQAHSLGLSDRVWNPSGRS